VVSSPLLIVSKLQEEEKVVAALMAVLGRKPVKVQVLNWWEDDPALPAQQELQLVLQ